jgi:methionyl-tRNA formyltransferase
LLEGEPLKIWRARVCNDRGAPGTVLRAQSDAVVVGCGQGALEITELQRPGARRLHAAEFLRGRILAPGTRLG